MTDSLLGPVAGSPGTAPGSPGPAPDAVAVEPDAATITVRRVGPRQPAVAVGARSTSLAADNHFASALITLWHRVSQSGGAVGFDPSATRSEIAPAVTEAVNGLRAGTRHAVVVTAGNRLVAAGFLIPKANRIQRHLAEVQSVMVDPELRGRGLGRQVMVELATVATELGVSTLLLGARDGLGLDAFYEGLGYVVYGQLPDSARLADGSRCSETRYRLELAG